MTVHERILGAVQRLAAQQSLHHISFAQIAKEAGVSWATVRRYVGEKAHLEEFLAANIAPATSSEQDTRSRILAAARRIFAREGYNGATLDQVAASAGLTKGAIYWYFASKSDLLLALVEERRTRQAQTLPKAVRSFTEAEDPVQALTTVLREQMRLCQQNQEWPRLLVEFLAESRDPQVHERFLMLMRKRQEIIRDAIHEAQQQHRLNPECDPFAVAVLFTGLLDGIQQMSLVNPTAFDPSTMASELARLLWPGLAPFGH